MDEIIESLHIVNEDEVKENFRREAIMCGIWAVFGYDGSVDKQMKEAHKISHRGPDAFRFEVLHGFKKCAMGFHHLAIVGSPLGMQPMRLTQYPHLILIYNGEIYNYQKILDEYNFKPESDSDGECILHLYQKGGIEFAASMLDGIFAFCLLDTKDMKVFLGRDTIGVKPLYRYFYNKKLSVCSEYKGLVDLNPMPDGEEVIKCVLPGIVETYRLAKDESLSFVSQIKFHHFTNKPKWTQLLKGNTVLGDDISENIRKLLTEAVRKRLMSNRRIGCLLSGGLDSSLVAALVVKIAKEQGISYPIQTFSVGLVGSYDLAAAKKVADYLGTEHHEVIVSPEEAVKLTEKVIYHLESYDSVMITSATAHFVLSNYIRTKTNTVVVLSGEGADEVTQGYSYFFNAPSPEEAHQESQFLLDTMHFYTVLRVERISAAHGLEVRVPFLDHHFIHYYLTIPPEMRCPKNGVEKYLLRKSFDGMNLIPAEILWRKKVEFADGVGSKDQSWYKVVYDHAESKVANHDWKKEAGKLSQFQHGKARSAVEYYHQSVYDMFFPNCAHLIPTPWATKWPGHNVACE